ncbi:MAG: prepilin peptidase [Acetobacteraceae bacterium]|nr:prepilin peptidase [Acetobacteraceae bacterium]MBV8522965.1 prepilin peptidase [Acetobacteraceae bacterium]MBV8588529.1 prepilin peptidase [Acetobacteraceae bacterium]
MLATLLPGAAALLLIGAALHDIAARTIPNWLCAALAGIGLILRITDGTIVSGLLAAGLVFALALLCWLRRWLGGGDAKLLAAVALVLPPTQVPTSLAVIAIGGGFLGLLYLALRPLIGRPGNARPRGLLARICRAEQFRLSRGGPLPYAVSIAAGALITLFASGS